MTRGLTSIHNGHLRGPVTLIIIAEHVAVQVSLPVVKARSVVAGIRSNPLRNRRGERGGGY